MHRIRSARRALTRDNLELLLVAGALALGVYLLVQYSALQSKLVTTLYDSAKQRVSTVEQRCHLTELDLQGAKPSLVAEYQVSLDKCRKQLKKVIRIYKASPKP